MRSLLFCYIVVGFYLYCITENMKKIFKSIKLRNITRKLAFRFICVAILILFACKTLEICVLLGTEDKKSKSLWKIENSNHPNHYIQTPSVFLRLKGGVGNQLFQFACSYALARKYKWPLHISMKLMNHRKSTHRNFSLHHFNLFHNHFDFQGLTRIAFLENEKDWNFSRVSFKKELVDYDLLDVESSIVSSDSDLNGTLFTLSSLDYCQSETFFAAYSSEIRKLLTINPNSFERNKAYWQWGSLIRAVGLSHSVFVHIRFGDTVPVPFSFYQSGMQQFIELLGEKVQFFIFSDQMKKAEKAMGSCFQIGVTCHFVNLSTGQGEEADDYAEIHLKLMTMCGHAIFGRSTFGWWGAYLIENPEKIVIAAEYNLKPIIKGYWRWQYKFLYYPAQWRKLSITK